MLRDVSLAGGLVVRALGISLAVWYMARRVKAPRVAATGSTTKDLKRKRSQGLQQRPGSEGLVDLIRSELSEEEEQDGQTQIEVKKAKLVVVVFGPTSTKAYQSYVIGKLMRYLRWANLTRKLFTVASEEATLDRESSNDRHGHEEPNSMSACGTNRASNGVGHIASGTPARQPRPTHRYTFSDRGKEAALTTIAVQELAKTITGWLGEEEAGVAVIEAGCGWASSRQGREALPAALRATIGTDVGLLWVELLPTGLSKTSGRHGERGPIDRSMKTDPGWRSANGLPQHSRGPGERVVDVFQGTGNLVGAGGHVFYESVRGGSRHEDGKRCFVSLADQGMDVKTQYRHHRCPLLRRVGAFAAALKRKKSWHGCRVYLTRHGESLMNQTESMGGDARLSENGQRFALVLADFVAAQPDADQGRLVVWCSPMKRAVQTARTVKCRRYLQWRALRELDTGVFNGYSYAQMQRDYPAEFAAREKDKLTYRFPEGEGYLDVVYRLHRVVVALEKEEEPLIIIAHQAVLRCLYAYFMDVTLRYMPHLSIPLHTVVKLTPSDDDEQSAGWRERRFLLMRPTPLEKLAVAVAPGMKNTEKSALGEYLA